VRNKNILITGGTSGLGLELVKLFLSDGFEVWTTGRNPKGLPSGNNKLNFISADFSDLADVSEKISDLPGLSTEFDIIINNAGILSPPVYTETKDGNEYTFQVNFLSHLLLNELIVRVQGNKNPVTLVAVTSPVYRFVKPDYKMSDTRNYRSFQAYSESKLFLLLAGGYLHNKYPEKDLRYIGYDPGTFSSGIYRMQKSWFQNMYGFASPFMRSPSKVARNLAGILKEQKLISGAVYRSKNSFRKPDLYNKNEVGNFITECYGMIEPFIR
jgi:NAD(P)-dependent dehydrogenase (short-subunit alcohol dehydrogenase family)